MNNKVKIHTFQYFKKTKKKNQPSIYMCKNGVGRIMPYFRTQ